jgi:ELWxxDGT repeat protein
MAPARGVQMQVNPKDRRRVASPVAAEHLEPRRHLAVQVLASLPRDPFDITAAGTDVYLLTINESQSATELHRLDSSGVERVVQPVSGSRWRLDHRARVVADARRAFIESRVSNEDAQLWYLDRRTDRATPLIHSPYRMSPGWPIVVHDGIAYFNVQAKGNSTAVGGLWRSDGTAEGTRAFDGPPNSASHLAVAGRHLYLGGSSGTAAYLWRTDGTAAGTVKVAQTNGLTVVAPFGNLLYFATRSPAGGFHMRVTDGTVRGTRDLGTPAPVSSVDELTPVGSRLFFVADTPTHGREVWVADARGTRRLTDLQPGSASSVNTHAFDKTRELAGLNESLVFLASDGSGGQSLWTIDAGDRVRKLDDNVGRMTAWSGRLYYAKEQYLRISTNGAAAAQTDIYAQQFTFAHTPSRLLFTANGQIMADDPKRAAVMGEVFNDYNRNGARETLEFSRLPNYRVYADLNGDGRWRAGEPWTRTNFDGVYRLGGLVPGTYSIRVVVADGWKPLSSEPQTVTVRRDRTTKRHLPMVPLGITFRGRVFRDDDLDGRASAGETGAAGFRVFVDYDGDGRADANEPSTRTAATGEFELRDAPAWSALVRVVGVAGWSFTTAPSFNTLTKPFEVHEKSFGVTQRPLLRGRVRRPAANSAGYLGWRVFADLNGNGTFQTGSELSALTDAEGRFRIAMSVPGSYRLVLELRDGYEELGGGTALVNAVVGRTVDVPDFRVRRVQT